MDLLWQLISNHIQDDQSAEQLIVFLVLLAVFVTVIAIGLLIASFFDPVRVRFLREADVSVTPIEEQSGTAKRLQAYRQVFMPTDQDLLSRTMVRLHHAGYHKKSSILFYYGIRLLLVILLPLTALLIMGAIPGVAGKDVLICMLVGFLIGYIGPSFALDHQVNKRQKIIQRAFPDALDLLVVCSEAGLSLNSALQKVAMEIYLSHPELADELDTVLSEMQAGVDRNKALKGLVDRTGVQSIGGLIATLSQCMRFGTDISEALRVYSEDLRDKRKQAAEEQAAKISVKMIFPLATCLLPCLFLIILVPLWMRVLKTLGSLSY